MSQRTFTFSEDDRSAGSVGGAIAPVSSLLRRPPPGATILVFSQRPAARCALADETSPIEGFEHIGEVSVRLMARWSLPRMKMLARDQEG
jgi:hypothetical protein